MPRLVSFPSLGFAASHWPALPSGQLDAVLDRAGTFSRKLNGPSAAYRGRDIVPMWIADMDFRCPQPIIDAVIARAQHGVFGYTDPPAQLNSLLLSRLRTVYGCAIEPSESWLRWLPGLIPGLNHAIKATCSQSTDAVVIPTPIYGPFLQAPYNCGVRTRKVALLARTTDTASRQLRFEIDWPQLEAACADPQTRLLHWCNPHNPVGRCWTRAELSRVANICVQNDVVICSDEVWGELPLDDTVRPFHSMLSLLGPCASSESTDAVPGLRERLIVLTSPSKCFNVAALDVATAVVPDEALFSRFRNAGRDSAEVTPFGFAAALAAYGEAECEAWRQRLLAYLRANRAYASAVLSTMDGVRHVTPEASYLMWIDASDALPEGADAAAVLLEAGVGLSGGVGFGDRPGTCRLNFGCPQQTLDEGLVRLVAAINAAHNT